MAYIVSCVLYDGDNMKVQNYLKVWRAKKDITQQQLADSVELSRQTINSIEKGKFVPSILTVLKITAYFETSVDEIFFISDDNK
jgi:putative transcriptional regulator